MREGSENKTDQSPDSTFYGQAKNIVYCSSKLSYDDLELLLEYLGGSRTIFYHRYNITYN
ncbi:hypothetical protein DY000_02020940 [Brassica cretica]|uniref:Uncharacterized protein n=1 Tax=Brassica cretica TaxID=69181 RepID=A0ABQ7EAM3_BRACR|nr:hypothetical protein DY000_02020940 [Brassica cretica]